MAAILIIFVAALSAFCSEPAIDSVSDSAASVPEWGNIEIESGLSAADSIPQSDTLVFTVKLELRGNPDDYAIAEPTTPPVTNLNLISTSQANRTERSGGDTQLIKEYKWTFVPKSIGMAYINPLRIQYVYVPNGESRSLATSRLGLNVTEPIVPSKGVDWIVVIIAVLIIGAGAFLAIVLTKKGRAAESSEEEESIPPEKVARQRMSNIKPDRDANIVKYIDDITRILYSYISERYGVDAGHLSRDEILAALDKKGLPPNIQKNLDDALAICNEVRFADHKATQLDRDRIELALESLLSFGEKSQSSDEGQDKKDK